MKWLCGRGAGPILWGRSRLGREQRLPHRRLLGRRRLLLARRPHGVASKVLALYQARIAHLRTSRYIWDLSFYHAFHARLDAGGEGGSPPCLAPECIRTNFRFRDYITWI
eukprot:1805139-Pleurochrysis_carterae.AAC.1